MADPDRTTAALPEHLRGLTYADASPEQVSDARSWARATLRHLDEADPGERERRRADLRAQLGVA